RALRHADDGLSGFGGGAPVHNESRRGLQAHTLRIAAPKPWFYRRVVDDVGRVEVGDEFFPRQAGAGLLDHLPDAFHAVGRSAGDLADLQHPETLGEVRCKKPTPLVIVEYA